MKLEHVLDDLHVALTRRWWTQLFTAFTRCLLAIGFIPPSIPKILHKPFTSLPDDNPVGRRQQALAEIAVTTLQLPDVSRTFVIAPQMRWSTDAVSGRELVDAMADSPWARPYRLDELVVGGTSSIPRQRAPYPPAARKAEDNASCTASAPASTTPQIGAATRTSSANRAR